MHQAQARVYFHCGVKTLDGRFVVSYDPLELGVFLLLRSCRRLTSDVSRKHVSYRRSLTPSKKTRASTTWRPASAASSIRHWLQAVGPSEQTLLLNFT